jgi:hypothetical protein
MKRIIKKYFLYSFVLLLAIAGIGSCTTMDEGYKDFIKNGEISYTGKIDSLHVFSGHNRVQVNGLFMADPKITECRIFWNNREDSLVIPVTRTQGVDALKVIIPNLTENIYNFEVRTYDKLGNKSIAVTSIGKVYGDRYQLSLINRPILSTTLVGPKLTINFATMDTSTGVYETDVTYTNTANVLTTVAVPYFSTDPKNPINASVVIPDYKNGSFSYRTLFKPDATCIDIFSSEVTTVIKP